MAVKGFKPSDVVKLMASVILCQLAGVAGSVYTLPAIPIWYAGLNKPSFTPPDWVFGPVWAALYLLMGVSLYLVWKKGFGSKNARNGLIAFGIQLALNALWSVTFFGLRSPAAGMAVITLLWAAITATILTFRKTSQTAALLLAPYLLWTSFAALLNLNILLLNP